MSVNTSNWIYRKLLTLLTILLVSTQMVLAQQDSTVDTEPKVYGNVYDGTPYYADSYESGDGSKDNPYLIGNDMQLAKLAHDVNNGESFSGKYFKLTKDIDLSQALWTPIGVTNPSTKRFFNGKFDGDGHTISNMHIVWTYDSGNEISLGLFSRLSGAAANETAFATVTNLTVTNARIEKKAGHTPKVTGTIKIGILAADLTQNAEISNIIIRNSTITDNEEAYTLKNKLRIGGIVGYLDAFKYFRIYNISADTKIDMLSAATLNGIDGQASVSGGIGAASNLQPRGPLSVWPTNIYVHSTKIKTNANSAKCIRGSVVSFINNENFSNTVKKTWYFTPTNNVTGTNTFNYGTEKEHNSFGKAFTEIVNTYIKDKKLDRKTWAYSATSNGFAFSSIALKLKRGKEDVLTVVDEEGKTMNDGYDWYISHGNSEPVKVNTDRLNPFSLPRQTYAQSVYATDGNSTTNTVIVNPINLAASLTTSKQDFTVNVANDSEEGLSNDELGLDITYEWYNGTERLTSIPTSQNVVTRPTDSSKGRRYYCKVTVKSGSSVLLEKYVNVSLVVYLCPDGVTTSDGKTYAKGKDDLTDDSWGYSPDKPMLTWKGAYSKLSANGSWDENTIVLMGTSSQDVTYAGFCLTPNYQGENIVKYDDWTKAKTDNPQLFRNTTITGKWDKEYDGQIEIKGASRGLPIWGDTRFENITFNKNGVDDYNIIYCQYNNILMDEGIRMTGFNVNSPDYGTIDGAVTNALHIFGGINNDGRFYPLNTPEQIAAYNASMPHGKEGFSIKVKSGFYSCISAGGRQTVTLVDPDKQNGIMGTPQQPVKCTIDIDIDRKWNDRHNKPRKVTMYKGTPAETIKQSANDYDAGVILAGNHEGAMYADVNIIIRSGYVARVVNGTLGAQTNLTLPYKDKTYNVPCNTFMGRANITLDPSSSVNNKDEYTDKRIIVTELYGGSTGRGHTGDVVVNNPFYGISTVTINGGTFAILPEDNKKNDNILCGIFGAGAGGMNGIGYGNTEIVFGDDVKCSKPQTDGGKFMPCGVSANFVYGGGQQGNVIGVTNVDILNGHVFRAVTGGSYSGYVFGSTQVKVGYPTYYHVNPDHYASGRYVLNRTDQKNLGLENNNGTEKTPTIKQNIYLLTDELVSQGTYEDIVAIDNGNGKHKEITDANKDYYFTKVESQTPSVGWDNVHIFIDEAVYGGGYSIAQGSSVLANNTTVLKFTDKYNADNAFTTDEELEELKGLPGGSTAGFGGNTLIVIGDNKDSEHITISRQDMKKVVLPEGTDLYGYYYKHYDNDEAANDAYTYRYISVQDKYFYKGGSTPPAGLNGIRENAFYENDSEGGIFGDGHLSYAQGFRSADVTGYGFAEHTIDNPKILNTFQRLDIIRLEDNCFSLLGARDYTVNEINKTPYSISRVGEIKMVADNIRLDNNGNLEAKTDNNAAFTYSPKARNYMGFSNNIHYVGAVSSNVSFRNEKWHNRKGELASATSEADRMSYQDVKQKYIDDYHQNKDNTNADDPLGEFQKRNDGTARNMIGIASGYAMKIQLCQEDYDEDYKKVVETAHYGPIVGVVEMNLINVRQDEGGGYVYADNNHKRHDGDKHEEDFLETTGNFVFPYQKGSYIVDDCFPTGYYSAKNVDDVKVHYWYVTGFHYYYNVNITGYTYQSSKDRPLEFDGDNKDGLTVLSGLKPGQKVRIQNWKMRSGHPEDKDAFSSDLEYRNYLTGKETDETDSKYYSAKVTDGYRLYVGGAATNSFTGARTEDDKDKETKGFAAQLSMREKGSNETTLFNNTLPASLKEDAKIAFKLVDMVDNTNYVEPDYFDKHLSKKSLATLVIKAPAYEEYVSDTNNKPIYANTGKLYKKTADGYEEVTSGHLDADNTYYQPQTEEFVKIDSLFMYDMYNKTYEKVSNISDITIDENNPTAYYVPREYTYTIYLTIEYVQGPTVSGHINVGNCVLPGEMIRVTKDDLVVNADQSFAVSGYYWRIGKREKTAEGKWTFSDTTPWTKENIKEAAAKGYDTFNQADEKGSGLFTGCHYDKTDDYLDIPAYYYMNGYGIQLGVAITGVDEIMQIDMQEADRLTVHNFHRMDAHKAGINLHLAEAIMRAKNEGKAFAEPRIYIADKSDLTAFAAFVDSIGNGSTAPRYGANAQFVLQNDLTMTANPKDGAYISSFAGILHGNGHVINGVGSDNALFGTVTGNIYNLGLSSGRLSGKTDVDVKPNYHCCFEYAPKGNGSESVVYRWDGSAYKGYTHDDFRLGRVAYDLNEYYLLARNNADSQVLKYVSDYYANGDYQYACRTDAITGKNTGITYLRIGKSSDIPNYEQVETRHDKTHPVDAPRLVTVDGATHYVPLFNDNKNGADLMNDYLFWGQSLQSKPADMPSEIASHQIAYMSNRVYRTAAYYGNTMLDAFHYNAYSQGSSTMSTYVHAPKTTAIDFTCKDDLPAAMGMSERGIFYPPVDDNATVFSDFLVKDDADITQNLLVYTADDNTGAGNEAYDVVKNTLGYDETTREALIKGQHVVKSADNGYATQLLHLVERTSKNENSEGEECRNNNLCVPIAFNVTDRAWYVRKPMAYAEDYYGAWEGICLPFTADKTVASLNGEITHFYGKPSAEENADPKQNTHTLHHEYWLRSLTSVEKENGVPSAVFQRPDNDAENGVNYKFSNPFFIDNYGPWLYNKDANPYYAEEHEYAEYPRLAAEKPYIVRFPGERYYEFDLSSAFYNKLLGKTEDAQTIAFNAYGKTQGDHTSYGTVTVPVTKAMQTTVKDGYAHNGTFAAVEVSYGKVYGINNGGTAFDDASALSTVMPFRTYMSVNTAGTMASPAYSHLINISELKGGTISPDAMDDEDNAQNDGIIVRPIGGQRVRVESTVRTRMDVVTAVGQLCRILDVQPGTATYSGFQPGLYIFGKTKVIVK